MIEARPVVYAALRKRRAGPMAESVIDRAAMERLDRIGGDTLRIKVVDLFFQRAPELFADMLRAVAAEDARALEEAAHAFKSSAGNVGAKRLMALLQTLEDLGRREQVAGAREAMRAVKVEVDAALKQLAAMDVGTPHRR